MMFPLWAPDNKTVFSSLFHVPEGFCCVLTADGFSEAAYRSSSIVPKVAQLACVRRVLYSFDKDAAFARMSATVSASLRDTWIYDISQLSAEEVSNVAVTSCCESWAVGMNDNLRVIPLPGTYCMMLNDSTAIGTAQVFAELLSNESIKSGALDRLYFP